MTFKEFLEKRPEDVKKAKACKNMDEFKKLVDGFGVSYKGDAELKEAYDFIKNEGKKLSDDDLNSAAGGCIEPNERMLKGSKRTGNSWNIDWASNKNKK